MRIWISSDPIHPSVFIKDGGRSNPAAFFTPQATFMFIYETQNQE